MNSFVASRSGCALVLAATLLLGAKGFAGPVLVSEDGAFGPGTITLDTVTGKRWLDLTESTGTSRTQMLVEIQPGGTFEGYRLATSDEVLQLYEDAGIDTSTSDFAPQNYAPIVALAALVGTLADNGNCGTGCTFFFSIGHCATPPPQPGWARVLEFAWFDNSSGLAPSYPPAPIGRASAADTLDAPSPNIGSWLVVPEPGALASGASAIAALAAALSARRRVLRS